MDPGLRQRLDEGVRKLSEGDLRGAAERFRGALDQAPDDPDALHLMGTVLLEQGDLPAARRLLAAAAAAAPERWAFHRGLGRARYACGDPEGALASLRRAIAIKPDCHEAHWEIWTILGATGRAQAAVAGLKARLAALDDATALGSGADAPVPIEATTLCCIDCRNGALALRALRLSLRECAFERVLFLTDQGLAAPGIETRSIPTIGSPEQYSRFVMKDLLEHIDTDHVLLVQWDGYVVNGAAWSDEFLLYDYLGAPWSRGVAGELTVGNGGFSLRSRRLLEALQDPAIPAGHPEDAHICRRWRAHLESAHGITFAPESAAGRFSVEYVPAPGATFGFHGVANIARYVDDPAVRAADFAAQSPP
jgi:tetratricopeptide (TPR) repeat protein